MKTSAQKFSDLPHEMARDLKPKAARHLLALGYTGASAAAAIRYSKSQVSHAINGAHPNLDVLNALLALGPAPEALRRKIRGLEKLQAEHGSAA